MKHVDDNSLVPSRGSGGPLAPWIDAFSDWARQQGYSRSAMSRRVSLATGFDAWLEHEASIRTISPRITLRGTCDIVLGASGFTMAMRRRSGT